MNSKSRVPSGVPSGGQFVEQTKADSEVALDSSSPHYPDANSAWDVLHDADVAGRDAEYPMPDGSLVTVSHFTTFDHNEYGGIEGRKGTYTIRRGHARPDGFGDVLDEIRYSRSERTMEDARWDVADRIVSLAETSARSTHAPGAPASPIVVTDPDELPEVSIEPPYLPYLTRGESSDSCLDAELNCSIDPTTGECTECGAAEAY